MAKESYEERKAKIRKAVLKTKSRSEKERYLMGVGIFDQVALKELDSRTINELVDNAMKVKGF